MLMVLRRIIITILTSILILRKKNVKILLEVLRFFSQLSNGKKNLKMLRILPTTDSH